MTLVKLTKSCLGIFDTETHQNVDVYEIPIDFKTWNKVFKKERKCRWCHKELDDWEKTVCIQWHFKNKKKTKISFRCYQCAQRDM